VRRLLNVAVVQPRTGKEQWMAERLVDNAEVTLTTSVIDHWLNDMTWSGTPGREWVNVERRLNGIYSSVRLPLWLPGKHPKRMTVGIKGKVEGRVWQREPEAHGNDNPFSFVCYRNDQIHCATGPAVYCGHGTECQYHLNGVRVPGWLITTPASKIDPALFSTIENAEVRREFVRKVGIDMIIQRCGAKVVDKQGDYELLSLEVPNSPDFSWASFIPRALPNSDTPTVNNAQWRYLKMKNPSIGVWHVEGVPNECRTVMEALRWREPVKLQRIPRSENGQDYWQQGDVYVWPKDAKFLKPMPAIRT